MATFGSRFKELRKEKNLTQDKIAEKFFIQKSSISKYENNVHIPEIDTLQKIADFFNVTVDYLLGRSDIKDEMLPKDAIKPDKFYKLPVLGVIRAGEPLYAEQNIIGFEYVADINMPKGESFFLKVVGDSMNLSNIIDESLVLVRVQDIVENGEIAVVLVNGHDATVKRFNKTGNMITLMPNSSNQEHQPIVIDTKVTSVKVIGKVVQAVIKF